jgi:hypothetical protein
MQQHQSILGYKSGRYLKLALVLCVGSIAAYAWHEPPTVYLKPYGGTPLGYTLGTIAALLIVWLMLLGVRKRRYRKAVGSLHGWTSAHVYLGTSLLVVASLHCAFEFGWNIHTLAYVLMVAVIVSGFFGVYAYLHYPELMTRNAGNETLETLLMKVADLDQKCRRIALDLPDEVNAIVAAASRSVTREMSQTGRLALHPVGKAKACPTSRACNQLKTLGRTLSGEQAKLNEQLLTEMTRKRGLVERIRNDLRYRGLLQLWLYFHVPLSFALLAALIAHVVSVFYYW